MLPNILARLNVSVNLKAFVINCTFDISFHCLAPSNLIQLNLCFGDRFPSAETSTLFDARLMYTFNLWSSLYVWSAAVCVHAWTPLSHRWLNDFLEGYRAALSFLAPNNSGVGACPSWSSLIWSLPSFTGANQTVRLPHPALESARWLGGRRV